MKTTDIKGKPYVEVNERIKYFRANFKDWALTSEIVSLENGVCVIKATVLNPEGVVKATGYAYEKEGSTFINKTSYIENCETSAWGRALGNLGIGIDTSIASAEEVLNASLNQTPKKKAKPTVSDKDLEFYEVVATMETAEDVKEYYASTKEFVDDRQAYHQLVCDRIKTIKGEK